MTQVFPLRIAISISDIIMIKKEQTVHHITVNRVGLFWVEAMILQCLVMLKLNNQPTFQITKTFG